MPQLDFGKPRFITKSQAEYIEKSFGTPCYVYSEVELENFANEFLSFPSAFGKNVRFAMKANSQINILRFFKNKGIKIDASSEYEAYRAINAGFEPSDISISTQELPNNLKDLIQKNVFINATSLHQIQEIGKVSPGIKIGVRINPGVGSGAFKAISTGGLTSGFGIWHEKIPQIKDLAKKYNLKITKIHIHIGSENTPESWVNSANLGLDIVEQFEDVDTLDMGGGFKMAIMPYEKSADLQKIGDAVAERFYDFYKKTGRKIVLEVEPGKYLVMNTCSLIAKVVDITDTGKDGYEFIKINSGMTELPRISMYGVQQPVYILNDETEKKEYVVIGHCCESGDIITCKLYDSETIETRLLNKAHIGDLVVIDGCGAYNASMCMKNYNSFPEAPEVFIKKDGTILQIRKKEQLHEIRRNEITVI